MTSKFKKLFRILRYLPFSIWFCLKFLPLRQALKIPILFYKPKFYNLKGKVFIKTRNIKFGMIQLGFPINLMYPNNGFFLEICKGGILEFSGKASIGNSSAISVGSKGKLHIGDNVSSRTGLKICAYHYINIEDHVLFAWDILMMDTDFHKFSQLNSNSPQRPFDPIRIGNNTFIGSRTTILKGTVIPSFSIVGANSLVNNNFGGEPYILVGGNPAKIIKKGIYWDYQNDEVNYEIYT